MNYQRKVSIAVRGGIIKKQDMSIRYLLFQMRRPDDSMRTHEVEAFARTLGCSPERITAIDLIQDPAHPVHACGA